VIGIVCGGFFAALAVLSSLFPGRTGTPLISLVFAGFAALGVPLIAEYVFARHTLTAGGLHYGRMFGGRGSLRWADVTRVRYSESMKWFRLDTAGGGVVRISALLIGLPDLARDLLAQVPAAALDAEARAILEAAAAGKLPSLWAGGTPGAGGHPGGG
jgi:hypothetical protein